MVEEYLCGTNRSEIFWVREENNPVITDKVVELDRSFGGIGLEVGGSRAQSQFFLCNALDCAFAAHFYSFSWRRRYFG